ncbi:hypothetical protein DPMN_059870 [Dreissena polymorpha]|uniref:Uncharacterized protein n=1 Tax=Dreissena polymorpha TaxID=45954 RepID=A0A9D4HFG4_DREPO|nr:hypothetical protein DPMN_059870 [Dreissena polymorpha]
MINEHKREIEALKEKINTNIRLTEENSKKSNHNEQYSRKNNVKVMDVKEELNESIPTLTTEITSVFKRQAIDIAPDQIVALHRIPTKTGQTRHVLIKFRNNHDQSIVMRKRKEMKQAGHRFVDDVTTLNTDLMSRLQLHKEIESTWFYNGSVFAQTKRNERIRFNLYDNIDLTIQEHRAKRK